MSSGVVKLRISRNAAEKLFSPNRTSVSKGIDKVLEKYSEKVEEDVLDSFLKERRQFRK